MKPEKKKYKVFNMVAASEISMPELFRVEGEAEPDVTIELGALPAAVHRIISEDPDNFWFGVVGEKEMWLRSPPAYYYVTGGNHITVELRPEMEESRNPESVRVFLLGTAFAMLQIQNRRLPIHGGALYKDGRALIITGASGAGKSTVTSALVERGLPFLADDVSSLEMRDGVPFVLPAYPQRKLCRDAAVALGHRPEELVLIAEERDKFAVRGAEAWHDEPAPLGAMVEILRKDSGPMEWMPVEGFGKLPMVHRSVYREYVHLRAGKNPAYMQKCLNLATRVPMYRVIRPMEGNTVDDIIEKLLALPMNG